MDNELTASDKCSCDGYNFDRNSDKQIPFQFCAIYLQELS